MSSFQKTIKYMAIGFAIFLAVVIISGIANAGFAVVSAITGGIGHVNKETMDFTDTFTGVKSLDIDNATGKLTIKTGETFQVEAENVSKHFEARVSSDGTLTISENTRSTGFLWFNFNGFDNPNSKITIYVPAGFVAERTEIETGAGTVSVEGFKTEKLTISAGAGNINGDEIVAEEVTIDGGVGTVTLNNVDFTDADFDCGVGNIDIQGILRGDSELDCGVGDVKLDLLGNVDNYDLKVDSGVGTIRLNGEKLSDEYETDKNADNSIVIDGGVGNVQIDIGE